MEASPKILQTRWLELRAWPGGSAPLAEPVGMRGYAVTGAGEDLQVTLVVHDPLERLVLAVRPAFLPAIRLSRGPAGPWEEAVAWGPCAQAQELVFWALRQDGGRWRPMQAAPSAGEAEGPDRYAAWYTDELQAGTA